MKSSLVLLVAMLSSFSCIQASGVELVCTFIDGRVEKKTAPLVQDGSIQRFRWKRSELPAGLKWVEVMPDFATAQKGEPGYFVMPNGEIGTYHEQDGERTAGQYMPMPVFGMKNLSKPPSWRSSRACPTASSS